MVYSLLLLYLIRLGNAIQPIYVGFTSIIMPPLAFLQKPFYWLKAISKYRATTSGAPNFGYDLCVQKIQPKQFAELDLSSWDLAYSGAEPVRAETLKQFSKKFAQCGFNYSAFYPCYGMAETTLFTTGGDKNQLPVIKSVSARELEQNKVVESEISSPLSRVLVSVGSPGVNTTVIIVNPESLTCCEEGSVGEIWVSGESITSGYWNRSEVTEQTFQAYLKDTGSGSFLRTGDLGFLNNRELFITGRLKDLIIIRGRNHYPQDIELTFQKSHPALRANSGAAFSIEKEGEERLVVVQEVERTHVRQLKLDEVLEAVNQAVSLEHELAIDTIVLLKPGSIPKTSSGKIQRSACRQKFLNGTLENVVFTKSAQEIPTQFKGMEFSLLYFSSNEAEFRDDKYRLLLEGAKFADKNSFRAIWIPERHFHPFGGLYPEPAVLGSALAMVTQKIRIRPGSVVLPLQNPVRVAEQWSVIDNLSGGRVDISFARGWNPNDFVLSPENYTNRTQIMFDGIKTVQKLWRGESVFLLNGNREETEIKIYPLPKQPELSIWVTCSGGKENFVEAGAIGANILTALLFQSVEELAEKIALYRESRAKNGYDPKNGHITLMLHTFVSSNLEFVRNQVRQPFIKYLENSIDLWRNNSQSLDKLTEVEREKLLDYAFERYFQTAALFGTSSSCLKIVKQFKEIGVDELACLIDFGVDADLVLSNLNYLNQLREQASRINLKPMSKKVGKLVVNSVEKWEMQFKNKQQSTTATIDEKLSQHINRNINQNDFIKEIEIQGNNDTLLYNFQEKITQEVINYLNISSDSVDLNTNFFTLGIDSLKAIEMVENIEKSLKISISTTLIFEYPTIAQLSKYLMKEINKISENNLEESELISTFEKKQKNVRPWLVIENIKPESELRLFCLPYAGGKVSTFQGWSKYLPSSVEVCVVDVPQTYEKLNDLFAELIPTLLPYLDKPFALYGHSVGGLIAFELCRYLRKIYKLYPSYLFVASQHAPQLEFPYPSFAEFNSPENIKILRSLTTIELPNSKLQNANLLNRLFRSLQPGIAIQTENYTYTVDKPLSCPIFVFGGVDDPVLSEEYLKAWQEHTSDEFQLKILPGGHLFLHEYRTALLREISSILQSKISKKINNVQT